MNKNSTGEWLFSKLFGVIIAVFIVGFGVQTYFFVNALMDRDQLLMKCLTVFSLDGCALIYFIAKNFYPLKSENSKHAVRVMFRACFWGSATCTVLWMILNADHFDWSLVPSPLVFVSYVLVTFAVTVNVLVFYYIWEHEYAARTASPVPEPPSAQPSTPPDDIAALVAKSVALALAQERASTAATYPVRSPSQTEPLGPFSSAPEPQSNGAK